MYVSITDFIRRTCIILKFVKSKYKSKLLIFDFSSRRWKSLATRSFGSDIQILELYNEIFHSS
jgi:hypothetical protein